MAILQISQLQVRRGLQQDLPQLAGGEFGWSMDEQRLFIGNGTIEEGSPALGVTEIVTATSLADFTILDKLYTFKGLASGIEVVTGPDALHPVYRTLQDKIDDYVSVKDFGAKGDGITDDTEAIQRALTRAYSSAHSTALTNYHRTIYFPAGTYKVTDTINIPPYTRIQGEGKRTTIITGTMAAPLAQFADEFGQVNVNFGKDSEAGITPEIAEYHFNDIAFEHNCPTYDQSCLVIDGGWTGYFNRVMFRGLLTGVRAEFGTLIDCDGVSGEYTLTTMDPAAETLTAGMAIGGWSAGSGYMGFGGTVQSVTGPDGGGVYTITSDVANEDTFTEITTNFVDMTITTNPTYDNDRGTGVAAVCINNSSLYAGVRNLIFNQCDFMDQNYGVEINEEIIGITLTSCYFDRLYRSVISGNNSISYNPYGYSIFDNYFRYSAAEGIWGGEWVDNIMSESNIFSAAGLCDWQASYPIINPAGLACHPGITFNKDNNFSIADSFDRNVDDYALFPNIETNGYNCYIVGQDRGVVNGQLTNGTGYIITLESTGTFSAAGLQFIPANYSNLVIDYTMDDTSNKRTGTFRVSQFGGTYSIDDEYNETADLGVVLNVNSSTGDIEYRSPSNITLSYNLNFFR